MPADSWTCMANERDSELRYLASALYSFTLCCYVVKKMLHPKHVNIINEHRQLMSVINIWCTPDVCVNWTSFMLLEHIDWWNGAEALLDVDFHLQTFNKCPINPSLPFCILETHFVVLCQVTSLALLLVHHLKGFPLRCHVVSAVIMFSQQQNNGNMPEIKQKPALTHAVAACGDIFSIQPPLAFSFILHQPHSISPLFLSLHTFSLWTVFLNSEFLECYLILYGSMVE